MLLTALAVAVVLGHSSGPLVREPADAGTPDEALARLRPKVCAGYENKYWTVAKVRPPCELVEEAVGKKWTREQLAEAIGKTYGIQAKASGALSNAFIYHALAETSRGANVGWVETKKWVLEALKSEPTNTNVLAMAMTWSGPREADADISLALEKNPKAPELIRELMRNAQGWGFYWEEASMAWFVAHRPAEALGLLPDFGLDQTRENPTAVYLGMLRQAKAGKLSLSPEILAQLTDRLVRNFLGLGLPAAALEVLDAAEPTVREKILAGTTGLKVRSSFSSSQGPPTWEPAPDVQSELALAFAETGRDAEAKPLFVGLKPIVRDEKRPWEACGEETRRALLSRLYGANKSGDPFDDAVALYSCREAGELAVMAVRVFGARYAPLVRRQLEYQAREDSERHGLDTFIERTLPEEAQLLDRQIAARRVSARATLEGLPGADAGVADDGDDVDGGAAPPAMSVFSEEELPAGVKAQAIGREWGDKIPGLPRGYWGVRAIAHDGGTFVVASSQAADPTGEVTSGAYWLLSSRDGKTFGAPAYLGIRHSRPYVITPRSELPAVEGNVLQLEAQVQRINDRRIMFPPVNDARDEIRGGLVLKASLEAIMRDSDADGLTDVLEDRLGLDPRKSDTDRDGVSDSKDLLPNLGKAKKPTAEAELFSAVFAWFDEMSKKSAKRRPPEDAPRSEGFRALYLLADPAGVAGLKVSERTVVISPNEYARMKQRFGEFYPFRFSLVVWNEKRDQAFIVYSESWRGGSLMAKRVKGKWVLSDMGSWIS